MDIWSAAIMFVLAFLGLILVAFLIVFLWLAHEYNITFSIKSKKDYLESQGSWTDENNWGKSIRENDSVS